MRWAGKRGKSSAVAVVFAIGVGVWNRCTSNLSPITIGLGPVSIDSVVGVARFNSPVSLDTSALKVVAASRQIIENLPSDPHPHYGISTGFGALATTGRATGVPRRMCSRATS
ncbi:MAG: aromatic amino acid lyase [Actinomycetales bacterium]|nr:aromatic amino acid lyase [Actinomycetales bacterium]